MSARRMYFPIMTVIAIVLFLILTSTSALAATPLFTESRITTHISNSQFPAIYGDNIVWQDDRNGNWDIYILNMKSKVQIHTTNKAEQEHPEIYGDRVVWQDKRYNGDYTYPDPDVLSTYLEGYDIVLENLTTKTQTRITHTNSAANPDIYKDWIVYRNQAYSERENWGEIYAYNIKTKKTATINNSWYSENPAVYEDRVVYQSGGEGLPDIYYYNLTTNKNVQVTNTTSATIPAIYGDKIVYKDYYTYPIMVDNNWLSYEAIYMYDIPTKTTKMITNSTGGISNIRIYGNLVVWDDNRDSDFYNGHYDSDIYIYNISTKQQWHTTNKSDQSDPAIFENKVVWRDARNGNDDIYTGTLINPPVAGFSARPVDGRSPLKVRFADKSSGGSTSWSWNFGDSKSSTSQNPTHIYNKKGQYDVSLTVKNAAGYNTKKIKSYIVAR